THDQALCTLFVEEYNEENVRRLRKRMEDLEDFEICYENDETKPVLLPRRKFLAEQLTYHNIEKLTFLDTDYNTLLLASQAQVVRFLNEVYLPHDPLNVSLYEARKMTTKQIFHEVLSHTKCLDDKSPAAFSRWCSSQKLHFLQAEDRSKRIKLDNGSYVRYRDLYVMKKEYHGKS
ncbi:uncharacterized protein BYT42DRAFT_485743, partial [Radiomyces spectabilis]|uniref:uncharacterized protein n=1 Tax=Radiomyces spectabilis TaxID=64574 RepID=UPI0022211E9A